MEYQEEMNGDYLDHANEYPDLDYTPNYPWVGTSSSSNQPTSYVSQNVPHELPLQAVGPQANGLWAPGGGSQREMGAFDDIDYSRNSRWQVLGDADDVSADPDYELLEEESSGELISDTNSESSYLDGPDRSQLFHRKSRGYGSRGRSGRCQRARGGRGGKGIRRGLRKPLEPSAEFKALHSQATMAFIEHDYEEAEQLALKAILINPEMFAAHSLLSEIHVARGNSAKALAALFNGAHTRPRDSHVWLKVAQLILERAGEDKLPAVRDAIYCYNRVIAVDKTDVRARYKRAALNRDLGQLGKAVYDYEYLLKQFPHETTVLRLLAETYIELDDIDRALSLYHDSISYYMAKEPVQATSVNWSDINIYAELYGMKQEFKKGVSQIKSLARWLLGRSSDTVWETFDKDDREWDSEDEPRRVQFEPFTPGMYEATAYGDGLPLELRIKLGIYRLNLGKNYLEEAMNHFEWLDPKDCEPGAKLFDYPDLFREVADALREKELFSEALEFYEPLQQLSDYTDSSYLTDMASCYQAVGLSTEAMDCYQIIIENDEDSTDAQNKLKIICKELGISDRASLNENISATNRTPKTYIYPKIGIRQQAVSSTPSDSTSFSMLAPRLACRPPVRDIALEKSIREQTKLEDTSTLLLQMQNIKETTGDGGLAREFQWMWAAKTLIQDFQSERLFFPFDKYMKFYGYSKEDRKKSLNTKTVQALQEGKAAIRRLGSTTEDVDDADDLVPNEFRGIPFHVWLDIFLEYALSLAQIGDIQSAYDTVASAYNANVFYHSPDSMFLIHVCWFSCALIANDEETLCTIARWFMREFQFVTDGYRLFSALNRLCDAPHSWYNSGPTQKYVLRQVKAMDFSLVGSARHKSLFQERASYSTKDNSGNHILAEDLDIGLIMLYGHILYLGKSYAYSINYFLRAFALDPTNPIINLSLALGYIHYAIKRQADNRHHLITQGFAFLFTYYDIRRNSDITSEKQEAEYNVARAYHMLGLTHLAVQYYLRCLAMDADVQRTKCSCATENFTREAAFALQGLWAASGDLDQARELTEKWLVI